MAGATTRQRYLDAVVQHLVATGRADLSLVVLAEAAGTSDRMLVYYFKTREALLTEAVNSVRRRRRTDLASRLARIPKGDLEADLSDVLSWFCADDNAYATRLFYDAAARGIRGEFPFDEFIEGAIGDIVDEAAQTARRLRADSDQAQTFGTLFGAFSTALACDVLATKDRDRVDRAITAAARLLAAQLESEPE